MCSKMQIDRHTEKDPDQTDQSDLGLVCLIRSKFWMIMVSVNGQVHSGISTCIFLLLSSRSNNKDDFFEIKDMFFCSNNF